MLIEWILVSERNPKKKEKVLLFSSARGIFVGCLDNIGSYKRWVISSSEMCPFKEVSHWHPLPYTPGGPHLRCNINIRDWETKLPEELTISDISEMFQLIKKNDELCHRVNSLTLTNESLRFKAQELEAILAILSEHEELSARDKGWILSVLSGELDDEL